MSIIVTCPGCRKSFKVSDRFAGKSGPCPSCKRTLEVPTKSQEVKVHAPQEFARGGHDAAGRPLLKPVAFASTTLDPVTATIIGAVVVVVLAAAWIGGRMGLFQSPIALGIGLLLVSPPLVVTGYTILRDAELEPYRGVALYIRSTICALAYIVLWGVFAMLVSRGVVTSEIWVWLFVIPPFLAAGGGIAVAAFDLDFGSGLFHYCFYILAIVLLYRAAELKWIWDIAS